ncbi:hypothetical protein L207DRAFT_600484 [Hyaloscypha variabilis F]|uniref:Uncharacterized protein n=1 Tax=Hyaloscypha variabilis (strain UAMH 11265 / GT02V1 / F) TaxID=1149755 RepID=A0A2J6RD62_HYAVF|nr:hypothetical protein L207DRAFT_600484 [Hyaloscypha variabilis F]
MVGLAASRWALEKDQDELEMVEETPRISQNQPSELISSAPSGSEARRSTKQVRFAGLEGQSQDAPPQFQGSLLRQVNQPATVGLAGSKWGSPPAMPTPSPQKQGRVRRGKNRPRNTNQSSSTPRNVPRAPQAHQSWATNVPLPVSSNVSLLPSNDSQAAPAQQLQVTNVPAQRPEREPEDEIL